MPVVNADPLQMRQLMQNLIGNSLKYCRDDAPPIVEIRGGQGKDGAAEITVSDNGIGFDDKYAETIFDIFQRLHGKKSKFEGTGVGLSICKKIVQQHGGEIAAQGEPGKGAKFIFTLPIKIAEE